MNDTYVDPFDAIIASAEERIRKQIKAKANRLKREAGELPELPPDCLRIPQPIPVAITLWWTNYHHQCPTHGSITFQAPKFHNPVTLKEQLPTRADRRELMNALPKKEAFIYTPIASPYAHPHLPIEIKIEKAHINYCPKCLGVFQEAH